MGSRTKVPQGFGNGAAYYGSHMNKLMTELKPDNVILQGGLVKAQGTPDMTVAYPDMIVGIGGSIIEVAGANTSALTAASGTAQVETATVVGTVGAAGAGNAKLIVTGAHITGSPLTITFAVANNDNASAVGGKARTAIAVAGITTGYTVGGTGADITLTDKTKRANDTTLNIAIDNDTCSGLTAAPTSANTTAGVADSKKMASLFVGANGTVDVVYGTEVPATSTPVAPDAPSEHARICDIGPILSTTTTITSELINNTVRSLSK